MLIFLSCVHALVGAGWLGSIFYSAMVLNPRTPRILEGELAERYLLEITHGNRYRVLGAFTVVVVTGTILAVLGGVESFKWLLLVIHVFLMLFSVSVRLFLVVAIVLLMIFKCF